jgi:hypothetical protein
MPPGGSCRCRRRTTGPCCRDGGVVHGQRQNLTITGLFGPGSATLTGGGTGVVLTVEAGFTVTLDGLTITAAAATTAVCGTTAQ